MPLKSVTLIIIVWGRYLKDVMLGSNKKLTFSQFLRQGLDLVLEDHEVCQNRRMRRMKKRLDMYKKHATIFKASHEEPLILFHQMQMQKGKK